MVTLPQAYHAGFSHGFNSAEAVNFMIDDWLPYAKAAAERYRRLGKEPVIDLDQILVAAARTDYSLAVHVEVARLASDHLKLREQIRERFSGGGAGGRGRHGHKLSGRGPRAMEARLAAAAVASTCSCRQESVHMRWAGHRLARCAVTSAILASSHGARRSSRSCP